MNQPIRTAAAAVLAMTLALAFPPRDARADEIPNVDYAVDGSIAAGAALVAYLIERLPIETKRTWKREMFGPLDELVRENFSLAASRISDVTLTLSVVSPLVLTFSEGFGEAARKRAVVYAQALAVNLAPAAASKFFISRPRPYTYSEHPSARAYASSAGHDSHRSFYSGHTAVSFAAAVASSTLFVGQTENREARMAAWAMQLALATGTANFRVRAGRHFYSDVVVGAVIGGSLSYLMVGLHAEDGFYKPTGGELAAMGSGIVAGALLSQLVPLARLPEIGDGASAINVAPMALDDGFGLSLIGAL